MTFRTTARPTLPSRSRHRTRNACIAAAFSIVSLAHAAAPVEFSFRVPANDVDPFGRDVWAEVITPSGAAMKLPAFYCDDGLFAVRARASEAGEYRLGAITETKGASGPAAIEATPVGEDRAHVESPQTMRQVSVDAAKRPAWFVLERGAPFQPFGANLAWAHDGAPVPFYEDALRKWQGAGLNWMRIWMAHWGRLNLDWRAAGDAPPRHDSPFSPEVAASWDSIVSAAEESGVYIQLVLQHHGQYSTRVNPNWNENPWNAANPGGFLQKPGDFFTSPRAITATARKYRYIVARWGYSPAIMAWELFNEVHWTDAFAVDHNEPAVAAWHTMMAGLLRHFDAYDHLVTTSTENLASSIYASMDYFQPHLYASNVLAAVRSYHTAPALLGRPVFHGEFGDDHMPLSAEQKQSGVSFVPPVWASLMGRGRLAAQPWTGWELLEKDRLGELAAVAQFARATGIGTRDGLRPFSAVVETDATVPLRIEATQVWQRQSEPDITLPLDGTSPVELAEVPRNLVARATHDRDNFPARATFTIDAPRDLEMSAMVTAVGAGGASLNVSIDGEPVVSQSLKPGDTLPVALPFRFPAGMHRLVIENSGDADWIEVSRIETGVETSMLASVGKRDERFIACWLWNREGVFAVDTPAAAEGTLVIDGVRAGRWNVTWWDTFSGSRAPALTLLHEGGTLRIETLPIARHAAVVLERIE